LRDSHHELDDLLLDGGTETLGGFRVHLRSPLGPAYGYLLHSSLLVDMIASVTGVAFLVHRTVSVLQATHDMINQVTQTLLTEFLPHYNKIVIASGY
jgi:hypothetical protein